MSFIGEVAVNRNVSAILKQGVDALVQGGVLGLSNLGRQVWVVRVYFHPKHLGH